jgi:two-component system chemotaxis response regulator CheB
MMLKAALPSREMNLVGIDIDAVSVDIANKAIFNGAGVETIPPQYREFVLFGSGPTEGLFTVDESIVSLCSFRVGNILDLSDVAKSRFDVILCRNVLIYYSDREIRKIASNITAATQEHGIICLGISESFGDFAPDLYTYKPGIYLHGRSAQNGKLGEPKNLQIGRNAKTKVIAINPLGVQTSTILAMLGSEAQFLSLDQDFPVVLHQKFKSEPTIVSFGVPPTQCRLFRSMESLGVFNLFCVVNHLQSELFDLTKQFGRNTVVDFFSYSDMVRLRSRMQEAQTVPNGQDGIATAKRVLIVDDEPEIRELFASALADFNLEIESRPDGLSALNRIQEVKFDLLVTDFSMPRMNGAILIRNARKLQPQLKCILVSGYFDDKSSADFDSSIPCLSKPINLQRFTAACLKELGMLTRRYDPKIISATRPSLIAIGASTGGPNAMHHVFEGLAHTSAPILLVQHMSEAFHDQFYEEIARVSKLKLSFVTGPVPLTKDAIFVATRGRHLEVYETGTVLFAKCTDKEPVHGMKPAVDPLFASIAQHVQQTSLGILMTGMGRDGAAGLKMMRDAGHTTVVQNEESCVVYGMPRVATEMQAAMMEASLDELRQLLHVDCKQRSVSFPRAS